MSSNHDPGSSDRFEHEIMESSGAKRRRVCEFPPKQCGIFLSHSGQEKSFVEQLYLNLKGRKQHAFFDQDRECLPKAKNFGPEILEAAARCRLGVVVVSEDYVTSKWPMLELSKFVECEVKLFPLFFKLSPSDLKETEVETRWKKSWRELVERGEVKEEVLKLWSEALKELRSSNGLEYAKFSNSEFKYGCAVVEEICKLLPPKLEWSTSDIQGCDRLCKAVSSMFKRRTMDGDQNGHEYLGLYGMGGVGKTTLCKAMCGFFEGEFGGRVCYVELPSDQASERVARDERVARLKLVVQRLAGFDKSVSDSISTEEQGWQCLQDGVRNQPPVFLAIDNVGDYEASREEAQKYVERLPCGSKVLVTARSREILRHVLGGEEYCEPIPRLQWLEAATLFLSKAAPKRVVSFLKPEEREIVERCLSECQFEDKGYSSREYHPLVLRALGTYFHDVNSENVMSWGEALENKKKLQRCREAKNVNDILGLNYHSLRDEVKLVFLDSAIYLQMSGTSSELRPWWMREGEADDFKLWVLRISEMHGVSPSDSEMMVKELQRLGLVEDSSVEVSIHDLYKEFARGLVEKEGSKEWQWWMSQLSNDVTQLKRLVLVSDKSIIGRTPRRFLEWRSLVLLDLFECDYIGPELELGGFSSLRSLYVFYCDNLKRVVCSCDNGYNEGEYCYKRRPSRGCMSELLTLSLRGFVHLEDLAILRHTWNLEHLEVVTGDWGSPTFPASDADSENVGLIDFRYLTALRVFSMHVHWKFFPKYDCDEFIRWLLSGLQLENLTIFDIRFFDLECISEEGGGYAVDLNEAGHLSRGLSVLSLTLPEQIEEVKGLHLMSNLRTLNLALCLGLRHLPDLRCLPKLEQICVGGCCTLKAPPLLGPGVRGVDNCWRRDDFEHECLQPYCDREDECSYCDMRKNDNDCWDDEDGSEGLDDEDGSEGLVFSDGSEGCK